VSIGASPFTVPRRSTKVIGPDGTLVEELPARLCMSLDVYEEAGTLHSSAVPTTSTSRFQGHGVECVSYCLGGFSPGTTHVEHIDEADGWFDSR